MFSRIPTSLKIDVNLDNRDSLRREIIEKYIHSKFNECYKADIKHYLPYILSIECNNGLCATVGLNAAEKELLYLEKYLPGPIEKEIARHAKKTIDRNKIIEVGNLVSTWHGGSVIIFIIVAKLLSLIDRDWVVFTATDKVISIMEKLSFKPVFLANATEAAIDNDQEKWGSYYNNNPRVMFGYIPDAVSILKNNILLYSTLSIFLIQVEELANKFLS